MANGVKTGGGSRKGKPNKATAAKAAAVAASGLTPLDYLISVMRDEALDLGPRIDAAKAAAQYIHPKPAQSVAVGNEPGEEFVTKIVREIVRVKD